MPRKKRSFSADFKFKVAIEAIQGIKTVNQIASEHELHPVQVSTWKKQFLERGAELFKNGPGLTERDHEKEKNRLFNKIGRLTTDVDFLKKKVAPFSPGSSEDD